ncbi:MAG: GHMP kinase [Selenomonadaceae bacterium]|nr:GHMP kinase [Selenomonadaceae bacterium]
MKKFAMKFTVKMRGTCGELAQGFFCGEPILLTCPIEIFSTAVVSDEFAGVEGLGAKSRTMLGNVLKIFGAQDFKFGVRLTSQLPRGKGMASSSADMAAVAQAVAHSLGKNFSPEELGKLCAQIEPTDGIFFDGVVAMNPLTGRLVKKIRAQEKFQIALFDYGGQVDTLKLNRRSDFIFPSLDDEINFALVKNSALANQKILPKKNLQELMTFAEELGAVAVNVAHSGTVAGIFFHEDDSRVDEKISAVRKIFDRPQFMTLTNLAV